MMKRRNGRWEMVTVPPEAAAGVAVATDRLRGLLELWAAEADLFDKPMDLRALLTAAYLQGVCDGHDACSRHAVSA